MIKTRVGKLVKVQNQAKKKAANNDYYAAILYRNSYNCYLFTDVELSVALERARKNTEDNIERNGISKLID